MKKSDAAGGIKLIPFLAISFLIGYLILGSPSFLQGSAAEQREYEADKFDENLTIQPNNFRYITFNLDEGEEFEIVYTVKVKEYLPIDIWFVNENNYLLFISDAQFIYYVDGSDREIDYTKKIVTLKEHDVYVLAMANYNNETVEVNVICELRTYHAETTEPSSEDVSIFLYPLLLAVIILSVLLVVLFIKTRRHKKAKPKATTKGSRKKSKKAKRKVKKRISKKSEALESEETEPEITEKESPDEVKPKASEKVSPGFCGYCGKPVDTPFCNYCGRKV